MYEFRPGKIRMESSKTKQRVHRLSEDYGIPVADIYGMAMEAGIDEVQRRFEDESEL